MSRFTSGYAQNFRGAALRRNFFGGRSPLKSAIYSTGDSLAVMTGGTYGGTFAARLDGRLVLFPKNGTGFPGQSAATVRTSLQAAAMSDRMSVIVVIAGRNGVLTDTSGTRAALQGIVSDSVAIGNPATRIFFSTIPFKPTEVTAGVGTTNYDLVAAHNAWLISTMGAAQVFDGSDISNAYPSGDDTHVTNAGYDVWCMRASTTIAASGVLSTALPSARAVNGVNLNATSKFLWVVAPDTAHDFLPKAPSTTESTWHIWFKAASAASAGILIGRYGNAVSTARLALRYSGGSLFAFYGNGVFSSFASAVPVDTAWHSATLTVRNIAGTYKGDFYFDGTVRGTQQTCGALSTTWPVTIGEVGDLPAAGGSGTSFMFLGSYYQPLIYNVGLTGVQVASLHNSGVPLAPSASPVSASIVHYPDFDNITQYNVTRGLPDRAGTNDSRTVGMSSADLTTSIP